MLRMNCGYVLKFFLNLLTFCSDIDTAALQIGNIEQPKMWIMILFPVVPNLFGSSDSKRDSEKLANTSHQSAKNASSNSRSRTRELRKIRQC